MKGRILLLFGNGLQPGLVVFSSVKSSSPHLVTGATLGHIP